MISNTENMEIMPEVLQELLREHLDFVLLDVRESWELERARFETCLHIPLGTLEQCAADIPETNLIVTVCHHGVRSMRAACYLKSMGKHVLSLKGGIDRYARCIDTKIPVY